MRPEGVPELVLAQRRLRPKSVCWRCLTVGKVNVFGRHFQGGLLLDTYPGLKPVTWQII